MLTPSSHAVWSAIDVSILAWRGRCGGVMLNFQEKENALGYPVNTGQPRSLFYANLPEDGLRLESAAYHELKEFKKFLQNARNYQCEESLLRVAWKAEGQPRRDGSQWVELSACSDHSNEPDATFGQFLADETEEVYECAPPGHSAERRERRTYFKDEHCITVLRRDWPMRRLLLERAPLFPELAIRPNTYPLDKQIEAIDRLRSEPAAAHLPLLRLLQERRFADEHWPTLRAIPEPEWKVLMDESRDGTLEQREFVRRVLATPDFAFLEGPPGSGKTTAICELILQAVNRGQRVLLSASTHVAVDNVLERIADGRHNEIIAVRIDRRDDEETPECVKGLRLDKFIAAERRRLQEFHHRQSNPSPAQALFRRGLDAEADGEDMVERLILDSANLVAGTTIGILQHPDLKAARRAKHAEPAFDMLIVDEASKTTFQEFLVPALWAKRWILVGDPRQLSPYADDADLAPNIRACLPSEWKREICLTVAEAATSEVAEEGKVFVSVADAAQADFLRRQALARASDLHAEVLSGPDIHDDTTTAFRLAEAVIVAGQKEDFTRSEAVLPLDIARLNGRFDEVWHRRRAAWLDHAEIDSEEQLRWETEIAWRLARGYEMRWLPEQERPDTLQQIERLLPVDDGTVVWNAVSQVARLALPSILESLMNGVGGRGSSRGRELITARSDGLRSLGYYSRDIYAERSQLLTFQHRMHPDISVTPRRLFYKDEALHDAKGMTARRAWGCDCFGDHRAVWISVDGRERSNRNENEARELCRQLDRFMQWADKTPRSSGGPWEIAVLTFYRGQEALLRDLLNDSRNERTGYGLYARRGQSGATTATIKLCTVDRFQGHEADVVFLSFVKTRSVGFLGCLNRLNVALTRARYQLVLVGAQRFFGSPQCRSRLLREIAAAFPTNTPAAG